MNNYNTKDIFSLFINIKKKFEKKKKVKKYFTKVPDKQWNKQPDIIKNKCANIVVGLNNNRYYIDEFMVYLFTKILLDGKITWADINVNDVCNASKLYARNNHFKDRDFITKLSQQMDIDGILDFYKLDESGENMMMSLVINRYVSPYFYIKFMYMFDEIEHKFEKSEVFMDFINLIDEISKYIAIHEKRKIENNRK